jgi:hypothetical protein
VQDAAQQEPHSLVPCFWSYAYRDPATGKIKTKGLGPADEVPLKAARKLRRQIHEPASPAIRASTRLTVPAGGHWPVAVNPQDDPVPSKASKANRRRRL